MISPRVIEEIVILLRISIASEAREERRLVHDPYYTLTPCWARSNTFDELQGKQDRDDADPHPGEGSEEMLVRRVEYKEVERDVQKGCEDNSQGGIPLFYKAGAVERICQEYAHNCRGKHVQERRADESEVPRHDRLDDRVSRKGRKEEKRIFKPCEAEGDSHHVDDRIHGLVILAPMKDGEPGNDVFGEFLDGRPGRKNRHLGRKISHDEFLHRDDDDDRHHAGDKSERNESAWLRVTRVFLEPKPKPCKRRKNASRDGYGVGFCP